MKRGYIKLWRRLQSNELWKERRVFSKAEAWIDILMEVQHSETPQKVILGMNTILCHQGESLKSLETWAKRWGWTKSKTRRVLQLFQRCSMIRLKSETVTTRLSVCNYNDYNKSRNTNETQMKRKRNANETQVAPDKNVKNVEKEKNKTPKLSLTEVQLGLIELLKDQITENNPDYIPSADYKNTWGKDLDKMMRLDKRSPERIREVIEWCQASDFWKPNIQSFGKLRVKFNVLTAQMRTKGKGGSGGNPDYDKHAHGF